MIVRPLIASLFASAALVQAVAAQTWVDITPASGPAPTALMLCGAIYDPVAHRMVIFAGQDASGRSREVWAFDLASNMWTDLSPTTGVVPSRRTTPATVYDSDNHTLLTFSGQTSSGFLNDTWAFDLTAHTWSEFAPSSPPAIRYGVASCYDVVAKTQVIFAGFTNQGRFNDTWRFDPAAVTWTDVSPASGSPLKRCLHAVCYDALNRRMIMYGGQNNGALGDIWAFDLVTGVWTELTPATGPDPRWFSTLEYDERNRRATMFSGNRNVLGKANDVWVFDLFANEWTELSPAGTPPAERDGAVSVYIHSEDRLVVFGGSGSGGLLGDVWSLNDLSDTPTGLPRDPRPATAAATLHQNYPNPFNPLTVIRYDVLSAGHVVLTVHDVQGRVVRTLADGIHGPGERSVFWDGRNDAGIVVGSGVYLCRLRTGSVVQTKKMMFLK